MYSKQMPNFIDILEKSTIFTQKLKKKNRNKNIQRIYLEIWKYKIMK